MCILEVTQMRFSFLMVGVVANPSVRKSNALKLITSHLLNTSNQQNKIIIFKILTNQDSYIVLNKLQSNLQKIGNGLDRSGLLLCTSWDLTMNFSLYDKPSSVKLPNRSRPASVSKVQTLFCSNHTSLISRYGRSQRIENRFPQMRARHGGDGSPMCRIRLMRMREEGL